MNETDRRALIAALAEPLRKADSYLADLRAAVAGEPLEPVSEKLRAEDPEDRKQTLADLVARLRVIERSVDQSLQRGSHGAMDIAEDQVVELLAIWCGLYFNGTPKPNIWQSILNNVDRYGSWPTSALTFKLYGDTYRIERRHWAEQLRNRRGPGNGEAGIVSVAEYPMVALDDESEKLSDETSLAAGPADGTWLNAATLNDVLNAIPINDKTGVRALLYAVAERLARLYSALEVTAYLRSGGPMKMIWRDAIGPLMDDQVRSRLEARLEPSQGLIKASGDDHPNLKTLPFCVLSSVNFGVVRDPGQLLWSSTGRSELSGRHVRYRKAVMECFAELSDQWAHKVVRVVGRASHART